tara:strand:- start:384 stop:809 length:426 start_codon:yes stop_codon:yes gene_type:complete
MNTEYKEPSSKIHRAGGIIFDDEKRYILLVLNRLSYLKSENKWGLPKGHLLEEEYGLPYLGARREILEETGIYFPILKDDNSVVIQDTEYFITKLNRKWNPVFEPKDKKEIHSAKWIPVSELKNMNLNRGLSILLDDIELI